MFRLGFAAIALFALAGSAPASCPKEIEKVWSAVEASGLTDAEKNRVAIVLEGARQRYEAGDEEACNAAVAQVRLALDLKS